MVNLVEVTLPNQQVVIFLKIKLIISNVTDHSKHKVKILQITFRNEEGQSLDRPSLSRALINSSLASVDSSTLPALSAPPAVPALSTLVVVTVLHNNLIFFSSDKSSKRITFRYLVKTWNAEMGTERFSNRGSNDLESQI